MKIVLQIGYSKALNRKKEGQLIRAFVNDCECEMGDDDGKYITTPVEGKKGMCWFLWSGDVEMSDTIRIECKTAIVGAGKDESRTFESIYYVDETATVREISIKGVGHPKYPMVKGKVVEMGSVSEADKRESDLDQFLNEGF